MSVEETNQDNGVSLDDLAALLDDDQEVSGQNTESEELIEEQSEDSEEVAEEDQSPSEPTYKVKVDGKEVEVPLSELLNGYSRSSDYTRKTQEVADVRKAVEQRAQLVQAQEAAISQNFERAAELKQLQAQLSQFDQVDWQALSDSDPVQAQKLLIARQQLERSLGAKAQEFQQAQAQYQQLTAIQRQQLLQEQSQAVKERLPDFSPKVAERIRESVKGYGYSDEELSNVTDARLVHVLHDAMKWRELQANKPAAMKKVAEAPRTVRPAAQTPKPRNQAASDRLKKFGRVEDLAALL